MKIKDLTAYLESLAPLQVQENWDNSGLLTGNTEDESTGVLICLDVTEKVLDEALATGCNLVVSHHPVVLTGLKSFTGKSHSERLVAQAIRNDLALYAMHTNLDNVPYGVNGMLCERLGLSGCTILQPRKDMLRKLVTFCPVKDAVKVREALFAAGAGHIGNYDACSFNIKGMGSFRGSEETHPYVGEKGKLHEEDEVRIETIYPVWLEQRVVSALLAAHPYEEVAYDLYSLGNEHKRLGVGMAGMMAKPTTEEAFLRLLKKVTGCGCIRHSALTGRSINRVAVCGGSGRFLITDAIQAGADTLVTGDIRYHDFCEAGSQILLADAGHYETEQFMMEGVADLLRKNFPTFAVLVSRHCTNPVNYL
jgi:dinuclear metal center YbgI/SA1388 family protein